MNIYVYGTGSGAQKFISSIKQYRDNINLIAFVDTNKEKIGDIFNDRIVIGLDELSNIPFSEYDYIFLATEFKEVYFKVLRKGIPENKIILVYPKIIDDIYTDEINKQVEMTEVICNSNEMEENGLIKLSEEKQKEKLDIYYIYSDNNKERALSLLKSCKNNSNIFRFVNSSNINTLKKINYDYIFLYTEDANLYYELVSYGINSDSIIIMNYKIISNLYDNEVEKRNNVQIIYKVPETNIQIYSKKNDYKKIVFQKIDNPLVSIIIPVYNNWEYTYNCLHSIKDNTKEVSYEIIIGDDNSNDETKNIDKYIENITVIKNNKQLGFLKNCNNASNYCNGKYILFLNNDTCVQSNWLNTLIDTIGKDSSIGLVGSKLVYPSGELQEAGGIIFSDGSGWNYGRLDNPKKPEYNYVKEVDYISGASILIRKQLWDDIGGFDEQFSPGYYEDTDLAFEIRKRGYKVIYQPESVVVHFEGISHGTDITKGIKSYQVKNRNKFLTKWKKELHNNCKNSEELFIGRDRSQNKKIILIIDHHVPEIDCDAGSRNIYNYIKVLLHMNIKVVFIGDNFERMEPYTTILEQMGVEVLYGSYYQLFWRKWILDNSRYLNCVLLHRPNVAVKYIDFIKQNTNLKILYHVADLHFLREKREYELTQSINSLKKSEYFERIEKKIIKNTDFVITLSNVEKQIIEEKFNHENVIIMPILCYEQIVDRKIDILHKKDLIFVGGFRHRPNVDAVLWFVRDIFPLIKSELPDIKIYIIGSNVTKEVSDLDGNGVVVKGFVSDYELTTLYSRCLISVVPLRFGAGVKGKIIEAMHNSIQIVSTSVGIEGLQGIEEYIKPVDNAVDIAKEIIYLYKNPEVINENINKYNAYLSSYSSYESTIEKFKEMLGY